MRQAVIAQQNAKSDLPLVVSESQALAFAAVNGSARWSDAANSILDKIAGDRRTDLSERKIFVESGHIYLYAQSQIQTQADLGRADAFAQEFKKAARERGAHVTPVLFIDDVHTEHGILAPGEYSSSAGDLNIRTRRIAVAVEDRTWPNDELETAHKWGGHPVFEEERTLIPYTPGAARHAAQSSVARPIVVFESELLRAGLFLADDLQREKAGRGLLIKGNERPRAVLDGTGQEIYLWQKGFEGWIPSCDVMEIAYRNWLTNIRSFTGGVVFLSENFRAQQERVAAFSNALWGNSNITSLLV